MLPEGQACPPEVFRELLEKRASAFGISLAPLSQEELARFLAELDCARRKTNLTGPLTADQLVEHALESVLGERPMPRESEIVDIGSGAGIPGLPIAIVRPDLSITALEPRRKRAEFLRYAIRTVPIRNASVQEARASALRDAAFDVATIRAIGGLAEVVGRAHFLRVGGFLLVWTTEAEKVADSLAPLFTFERIERVPNSHKKVIALYRKRST